MRGGSACAGRAGYLAITALLGIVGWGVATRLAGWGGADATVGLGAAWGVQAVAFWKLTGALSRGQNALAVWLTGIAARATGLAVLWIAGVAAGGEGPGLVASYGLALVAFLLVEAGWLAGFRPGRGS
ncbi:MAG: hypothetical protein ACE5JR_10215 [Gemmatimonadota bacterium]